MCLVSRYTINIIAIIFCTVDISKNSIVIYSICATTIPKIACTIISTIIMERNTKLKIMVV